MIDKPLYNWQTFSGFPNQEGEVILRLLPPLPGENWFIEWEELGYRLYCYPVIVRGKELDGPRLWTVPQGVHDKIIEGMLHPLTVTTESYGKGMNPWIRYPYLWLRQVFWYLFPRRQAVIHTYEVHDPFYGRDFHCVREKKGGSWTYHRSYFDEYPSPINSDPEKMKVILSQRILKELIATLSSLSSDDERPPQRVSAADIQNNTLNEVPVPQGRQTILANLSDRPANYSHWIMEKQGTSASYNMYKSPNTEPVFRLLTGLTYTDFLANHAYAGDTVEFRNAHGKHNEIYRIRSITGMTVMFDSTGEHTEKTQHQTFAPRSKSKTDKLKPYEWLMIDAFLYPRVGDNEKIEKID